MPPLSQTPILSSRLFRENSRIWPTLVAIAIIILCARVALTWTVFSDTSDEPYHIGAAISLFEAHKLVQGAQHPPLARLLPGLVLYTSGVRYPPDHNNKVIHGDLDQLDAYDAGNYVLLHSPLSYWQVLVRARAVMLPFPVAAIIYLYLLGRYLAGRRAAAIAAIFFSFDPALLGHSSWVTTDVPATAGFLAILYHGLRWAAHPTWRRALIAGAIGGLGLSCKFSCAAAVPAVVLILLCRALPRGPLAAARFKPYATQAVVISLLAVFVLWATYLFDVGPIGQSAPINDSPTWAALPTWIKNIPVPMPSLFYGLLVLHQHEHTGHVAYALGMKNSGGWWWYFPLVIAVKEPVALLATVILSVALALRASARGRRAAQAGLGRARLQLWLVVLIPLVLYMTPAIAGRIDIGIRHILPAIPLLYLLAMLGLRRGRGRAILAALAAVAFVETAAVHPDYLAFFNFPSGGPMNGQHLLLDSNLDWGQDQARLAAFLDHYAQGRAVTLRLFGNVRMRDWPHADAAHGGYDIMQNGFVPWPLRSPAERTQADISSPAGLLVVSKNIRFDVYPSVFKRDGRFYQEVPLADLLTGLCIRPNVHVGYSIDVYDLDHRLPADRPGDPFAN